MSHSTGLSRTFSLVFCGAGWLTSAFLLLRGLALRGGGGGAFLGGVPSAICAGCDSTLGSASAWQLGVPVAAWGLLYFAIVGLLLAFATSAATRFAFILSAAGAGASLILAGAVLSSQPCPLCLVVHAANIGLLASLWLSATGDLPRRRLALLGAFAVITGALVETGLWNPSVDAVHAVEEFRSTPPVDLPLREDDPVLGPADARVRLVVFSSFQCPACREFSKQAHALRRQYPTDLAVVFKHFPLGKECNPGLTSEIQPRACAAAFAAEAARLQSGFWPYHDRFFAGNLSGADAELMSYASSMGVDVRRWDSDRQSPAVRQKVLDDVALGMKLRLPGTPTLFLNGRRIQSPGYAVLQSLIEQEIALVKLTQSQTR